jgi:hypothetical protein
MVSSNPGKSGIILILLFLFLVSSALAVEKDISYKKTIRYFVESSGKRYILSSEVVVTEKFLSKSALQTHFISIYEPFYAPVENIKCRLNNVKIKDDNIYFENIERKDIFIGNNKVHFIKLPGNLKQGDEIKYSYEQKYKEIAYIPIENIPNINSVDELIVDIEHPEEVSINFDFFFPHKKLNYTITNTPENTVMRFDSLSKFNEVPYEDFKDLLGAFIINIKQDKKEITPRSPAAFMIWYSGLSKMSPGSGGAKAVNWDKKTNLKPFFQGKIKDDFTPIEKLTIINNYVRDSIRYVANERGIKSIVPDNPSDVFERKYGDCKDKAGLVSAIAKEYGLEVIPALTSTDEFLSFSLFHMNVFNHVICSYKSGNQYRFFDPTAESMAFSTLHEELAGKPAFIMDTLNPHYEIISKDLPPSEININISGSLDSLRNAYATITLHNDLYAYALDLLNNSKEKDFRDIIPNFVAMFLRNIGLEIYHMPEKTIHNPEKDNNSITFSMDADLSRFIIPSTKKSYLPKAPFIFINDRILQREKDSSALFLSEMPKISLSIELKSDACIVSSDSISISLNPSSGYYASAKNENGNILKFNYVFNPPYCHISSDGKSEFIKFCKSYFSNRNQMFVLTRKTL